METNVWTVGDRLWTCLTGSVSVVNAYALTKNEILQSNSLKAVVWLPSDNEKSSEFVHG